MASAQFRANRDQGNFEWLSDELDYGQQRYLWMRSLSDPICRELAADYMRGDRDEATQDAFLEYRRRWPSSIPRVKAQPKTVEEELLEGLKAMGRMLIPDASSSELDAVDAS